jgi:hypothetical protein
MPYTVGDRVRATRPWNGGYDEEEGSPYRDVAVGDIGVVTQDLRGGTWYRVDFGPGTDWNDMGGLAIHEDEIEPA